jgi:hypothetical protein
VLVFFKKVEGKMMATATLNLNTKLSRALELLGGSIDPDIEESFSSIEARILAQAMENVEQAERSLREIQKLVGDLVEDYEEALA